MCSCPYLKWLFGVKSHISHRRMNEAARKQVKEYIGYTNSSENIYTEYNRLELHARKRKKTRKREKLKESTRKRKNIGFNKSCKDLFSLKKPQQNWYVIAVFPRIPCVFLFRLAKLKDSCDSSNSSSTKPISCLIRMTPFPLTHV